jgi:hypothetical protein
VITKTKVTISRAKNEYILRGSHRLKKTGTIKDYGNEEKKINRKRNKIIGLR